MVSHKHITFFKIQIFFGSIRLKGTSENAQFWLSGKEQPTMSRTTKIETDERWSRVETKVRCAKKMSRTSNTNDPPGAGASRTRTRRHREHPKDKCPSLAKAVPLLSGHHNEPAAYSSRASAPQLRLPYPNTNTNAEQSKKLKRIPCENAE